MWGWTIQTGNFHVLVLTYVPRYAYVRTIVCPSVSHPWTGIMMDGRKEKLGFLKQTSVFQLGLRSRSASVLDPVSDLPHHSSLRDWYLFGGQTFLLFTINYLFVVIIFFVKIRYYGTASNTFNNSIQIQFNRGLGADAAALPSATLSTLV